MKFFNWINPVWLIKTFFNWMKKKKDFINLNYKIEYFNQKYWLLIVSVTITIVYFLTSFYTLIRINAISVQYKFSEIATFFLAISLIIFIISFLITIKRPSELKSDINSNKEIKPFTSFIVLLISTILYLVLISCAVGLGGAKESYFSPIFVSMCSLSVVFPKTKKLKSTFAISSIILFVLLNIFKINIQDSNNKDNEYYTGAYVLSTLIALGITFIVTLKFRAESYKNSELKVFHAEYTPKSFSMDITDKIQAQIKNNNLDIKITNELAGKDPYDKELKKLIVFYEHENPQKIIIDENQNLKLP